MILFLGSGTSLPTGLPAVGNILNQVLQNPWHRGTDGLFYPGSSNDLMMGDPTASVQRFIHHVKGLIDVEHAKRGFDEANYEDLFFVLKQVADAEISEMRNAAIESFVERLRSQEKSFPLNEDYLGAGTPRRHLYALASLACELIQAVVRETLATPKKPVGLTLVAGLAQTAPLDIVTLNHDTLIERLLRECDIPFADGFGKPDGEVRWFEPSVFDNRHQNRLLKLHGSINWFEFVKKEGEERVGREGTATNGDPWHVKTADGAMLQNGSVTPLFLTGVGNKTSSYNSGIYAEMIFRFHEALKTADTMVMSGYGWGDKGVNVRILDWLHVRPSNRLFLLHRDPEGLIASGNSLSHRYERLVEKKQLIMIRKWLQDVSCTELLAYLEPVATENRN